MMADRIAVLGTGIMGRPMAARLLDAGFEVNAWNRTRAKADGLGQIGARVFDRPSEAAKGATAAIVMVLDGPTSDTVIFGDDNSEGVLGALEPGATLIVMSSIPVETARAQAVAADETGVRYLDAPVSGGEPGAKNGTLAIMAGGDPATFEAAGPIFSPLGRATLMGPAGAGSLAKLANQLIVGSTICVVAEALILLERGGGRPEALSDALRGGFADSAILQNHGRRMAADQFEPGALSRIQLKDMRTIGQLAKTYGLSLPLFECAAEVFEDVVAEGDGERDHNAAYLSLQRRNADQQA